MWKKLPQFSTARLSSPMATAKHPKTRSCKSSGKASKIQAHWEETIGKMKIWEAVQEVPNKCAASNSDVCVYIAHKNK